MHSKIDFILTAAGTGKRFGDQLNKIFAKINHKYVITHCLEQLENIKVIDRIYITINKKDKKRISNLLDSLQSNKEIHLIFGGDERYISVQNALKEINQNPKNQVIMVHDAARPCLSKELVAKLYESVLENGVCAPVIPIKDTLRKVKNNLSQAIDRTNYYLTQTPQCFLYQYIKDCLLSDKIKNINLTDEISYFEYFNLPCGFVRGEIKNIKITYPEDIILAEFYLKQNQKENQI